MGALGSFIRPGGGESAKDSAGGRFRAQERNRPHDGETSGVGGQTSACAVWRWYHGAYPNLWILEKDEFGWRSGAATGLMSLVGRTLPLDSFNLPDPPQSCECGADKYLRVGVTVGSSVKWYFCCRSCGRLIPVSDLLITP